MREVSEQSQYMGRKKDPILIYLQAFIFSIRNQTESRCKCVREEALCVIQWVVLSKGQTKLSEWPLLTLKSAPVSRSSLRYFCFVLMMSKSCSVSVSHGRSRCVCIRATRHVSFQESNRGILCVRLEMSFRGKTRFMEVEAFSCAD